MGVKVYVSVSLNSYMNLPKITQRCSRPHFDLSDPEPDNLCDFVILLQHHQFLKGRAAGCQGRHYFPLSSPQTCYLTSHLELDLPYRLPKQKGTDGCAQK